MAQQSDDREQQRRKFVDAWNNTLIKIWKERIVKLHVVDKGNLYRSPQFRAPVDSDGRFVAFSVSQFFLEYGLWQDLGVGRNTRIGNTHRRDNDGFVNRRVGYDRKGKVAQNSRRPWYSTKYYASSMKLKEFMSENLADEFVSMVATLDPEKLRSQSDYYRRKGLS